MTDKKLTSDRYESIRLENQLCFPLYACSKEVIRQYRKPLEPLNLTYTQYIVMMVLWEKSELTVGELGKKLYLDTGTLSPLLKAMEEKGLLERNRSKADERIVTVKITEKGEELQKEAMSVPEEMGKCIHLEADEAKALYGLLYKLL